MPDFSKERKTDRTRVRGTQKKQSVPLKLSSPKSPKVKPRQSPLSVFSRAARDFRHGIDTLQRLAVGRPEQSVPTALRETIREHVQAPERTSSTTIEYRHHDRSVTRETRERDFKVPGHKDTSVHAPARGRTLRHMEQREGLSYSPIAQARTPRKQEVRGRTKEALTRPQHRPAQRLRSDRRPDGVIKPPAVSYTYRAFKRPIRPSGAARRRIYPDHNINVTTADAEAAQQVREPYTGEAHQLPAAARVAQVIRADALLREEGRQHPTIRALASAAREGRKRYVADVDPGFLQKTFSDAFGGATRAEQALSSPVIHDMVERHRFAVESVQRRVESIERRARQVSPAGASAGTAPRRVVARRGRSPVRQSASPPRLPIQTASSPHHTPKGDERTHVHELQAQLSGNDFLHIPAHSERYEQEAAQALSEPGSNTSASAGSNNENGGGTRSGGNGIPSVVRAAPVKSGNGGGMSDANERPQVKQIRGEVTILDGGKERRGEVKFEEI